ncbi:MAG: hydroxymethylglutaryl-CoA reductase, degradative [Pseudomonadota bacterium]
MGNSRIPGFYKLTVSDRLRAMEEHGWLTKAELQSLGNGHHLLDIRRADKMIENVVGIMGLPIGMGLNFLINRKEYVVPLVVEEPSIVAALSSAAKIFSTGGGIRATTKESLLIGQIQVVSPPDAERAKQQVQRHAQELIDKLNKLHPNMVTRGGGVMELDAHIIPKSDESPLMLIVHIYVDTCDAMGANLVNSMCEEIAADVEALTGGRVFLRILSNLTDRSVVKARVKVPLAELAGKGFSGEEVRDGIILASQFAAVDPYRAATHNKGIMNGIDPLAIATGNDWRAIEAAAHAYAARSGRYSSLTRWSEAADGDLVGEIDIPIKVGIQGGSLEANETVKINLEVLGIASARELGEVMASVGLAQNFSAIKALSTEGIQKGHMSLHARSVAVTANAPPELFETVVSRLIQDGDIKVQHAKEVIAQLTGKAEEPEDDNRHRTVARAFGKIILLGEHAVVYGRPAIAVPFHDAVVAEVMDSDSPTEILVPAWDIDAKLSESNTIWWSAFQKIFSELGVSNRRFSVNVKPNIPAAMGLGGSAAMAVAIIRGVEQHFRLGLTDEQVNHFAFQCEKAAHGTPSGIDNTIATFGRPLSYRPREEASMEFLELRKPLNLVIGISDRPSLTVDAVARVRDRWRQNRDLYEMLFDNFQRVAEEGLEAIKEADYVRLGHLMTVNHGLLSAIQVSCPELDRMVQIAKDHGALGAKLTGAGGGGSIVAVCDGESEAVSNALEKSGFKSLLVKIQHGA